MRRLGCLLAVASALAAGSGSGGREQGVKVGTAHPAVPSSEPGSPAISDLLDFTLPGVTGPNVRGADYAGKSLALWFWAPW